MGKATASAACSAPEAAASAARPVASATAPVARRPQKPRRGPPCRRHPLLEGPRDALGARAVAGEGLVEELRVGFDGLPRQILPGLLLPLCLLGEPQGACAARIGLLPEVASDELGELPGALLLALAGLRGLLVDEPVGLCEGFGEASGRLVYVSSSCRIRHVLRSFSLGRRVGFGVSYPLRCEATRRRPTRAARRRQGRL